jgi:hypothetical protein
MFGLRPRGIGVPFDPVDRAVLVVTEEGLELGLPRLHVGHEVLEIDPALDRDLALTQARLFFDFIHL